MHTHIQNLQFNNCSHIEHICVCLGVYRRSTPLGKNSENRYVAVSKMKFHLTHIIPPLRCHSSVPKETAPQPASSESSVSTQLPQSCKVLPKRLTTFLPRHGWGWECLGKRKRRHLRSLPQRNDPQALKCSAYFTFSPPRQHLLKCACMSGEWISCI